VKRLEGEGAQNGLTGAGGVNTEATVHPHAVRNRIPSGTVPGTRRRREGSLNTYSRQEIRTSSRVKEERTVPQDHELAI
jgi:hypothetical protein